MMMSGVGYCGYSLKGGVMKFYAVVLKNEIVFDHKIGRLAIFETRDKARTSKKSCVHKGACVKRFVSES